MTQQNINTMQHILDALDQNPELQHEFHKHLVAVIRCANHHVTIGQSGQPTRPVTTEPVHEPVLHRRMPTKVVERQRWHQRLESANALHRLQ